MCSTTQTPPEMPTDLHAWSFFFLACSGSVCLCTTAHTGLWSLFCSCVYHPHNFFMSGCFLHWINELPFSLKRFVPNNE